MRISWQISGNATNRDNSATQGRGEYEWVELQPSDPTSAQLLHCRVLLRLSANNASVVLDTACELEYRDEKSRIRIADDAGAASYMYPIYHIAAALLMPCPTRTLGNLGSGQPVLRSNEYMMSDIQAGAIPLPVNLRADITVASIRVANQTVPAGEEITIATRLGQILHLWVNRHRFPQDIADLLEQHETLVRGGDQISITGRPLVERLSAAVADAAVDLDIAWATRDGDPLPALLEMAGYYRVEVAAIPIEQIPAEFREIRRREVARQRRLAAIRGPESTRFRRQVREAYRSTCVVCGLTLPALWDGGRPGVDSAHILPDGEFNLNVVSNGLCLCKLHHWAFDEGIIEIRHEVTTGYSVAVPDEARVRAEGPPVVLDLGFLQPHLGLIPAERLPAPNGRPNPVFLQRLREWLYPET